jgi:hypothetical protein
MTDNKNPAADVARGASEIDQLARVNSENTRKQDAKQAAVAAMAEIFADRCHAFANRVALGNLALIEGVDACQSAADISGLTDMIGVDAVQAILVAAFMRRRADA